MKVDWVEYALNLDPTRFENFRSVRTEPNRIECGFNAHWNASADTVEKWIGTSQKASRKTDTVPLGLKKL